MSGNNSLQTSNKLSKTKKIALYGILSAIIIIMSFTPLGFLKIGTALEITFLPIPVAIGAALLGPVGGLYFGSLFGIMSFLQALLGLNAFGVALLAENPIITFLLLFVPRALMGLCCAVIFKLLSKIDKTKYLSFIVSSFSAAFLNSVFFLSTLRLICFVPGIRNVVEKQGMPIAAILLGLISINAIVEVIVCTAVGFAVSKALSYFLTREKSA